MHGHTNTIIVSSYVIHELLVFILEWHNLISFYLGVGVYDIFHYFALQFNFHEQWRKVGKQNENLQLVPLIIFVISKCYIFLLKTKPELDIF